MKSIYNYTLEELTNYLLSIGEKPFRATQIYEWLYRGLVSSFDEMTNISSKLISKLKEEFTIEYTSSFLILSQRFVSKS